MRNASIYLCYRKRKVNEILNKIQKYFRMWDSMIKSWKTEIYILKHFSILSIWKSWTTTTNLEKLNCQKKIKIINRYAKIAISNLGKTSKK